MTSPEPGFVVVQGNRLEALRDLVFAWIENHPLDPLEEEIFLVQSNGAADWLKIERARAAGICAAVRIEPPGGFLWRMYRRVLGTDRLHAASALDRESLTWRLMRELPLVARKPSFEPIARFLADADPERRLQLARRLAEVFDQYQVYRGDWLADWERGKAVASDADGRARALPEEQRWQAALWRALVDGLDADQKRVVRPHAHRAALAALAEGRCAEPLPRRVVVFGASHVSSDGLAALAAFATRMQVLVALPNPCRWHWSDILSGRELLHAANRRLPVRDGVELATVPYEAMHLHANPLLAAWGRQGRDLMRQLDAFDDVAARARLDVPLVDVFDDGPGTTLLQRVQAGIRDLVPGAPESKMPISADDRSIVFHVAHGVQREVEVLHDQLLQMLADGKGAIAPRDVVVMVPDIEAFAPAVRAVFGQYARDDARHVAFDIADLKSRGSDPLLVGLEWLLRLPDQRIRLHEVRDLLDVPAAAARAGLANESLPRVFEWLAGAGVRWGLDADHRASLGLGSVGDQNTWAFGLKRLLLGYANGDTPLFDAGGEAIAPFPEVGGLDAADIGAVIAVVERIEAWRAIAARTMPPRAWAEEGRALIDALFEATDERERLTLAALQSALSSWLAACEAARFEEPVPLAVAREGWLEGVDALDASRRFMRGGVTFCTLVPLRAIPFQVVCLLGMNDGDFPRTSRASDFDLIALPGQARPGDRSRRDDDRYLMLEALLSARRTLYVSWRGRNPRTNDPEPPSVLVAQLRDHLDDGWVASDGTSIVERLTIEHPLQSFSRRYFEVGGPSTYAREWRVAHDFARPDRRVKPAAFEPLDEPVTIRDLARFVRRPLEEFFSLRLSIGRRESSEAVEDDEPFEVAGLDEWSLVDRLIARPAEAARDGVTRTVAERVATERASGSLPIATRGDRLGEDLVATAAPVLARWSRVQAEFPDVLERVPVRVEVPALAIDDWLDDVRGGSEALLRIELKASRLRKDGDLRTDVLVDPWIAMLVAVASGHPVSTVLIGCDAVVTLEPVSRSAALAYLETIAAFRAEGLKAPLPIARKTALAYANGENLHTARQAYEGRRDGPRGERESFALAREYPDFAALVADGRFATWATLVYGPIVEWAASAEVEDVATMKDAE